MITPLPKTEDQRPKTVSFRSYNYWDRDEPKGWLTALVVVVFLALFLWLTCSAHCADPPLLLPPVPASPLLVGQASLPAILIPPDTETRPLVPADFYAAERLLLLEGYPGRVLSGAVERQGDTQTLICDLLVAPGKVETVMVRLAPAARDTETRRGGEAGTGTRRGESCIRPAGEGEPE